MIHEGRARTQGRSGRNLSAFRTASHPCQWWGDWASLPGEERVRGPARDGSHVLHLREETSVDKALANLARGSHPLERLRTRHVEPE